MGDESLLRAMRDASARKVWCHPKREKIDAAPLLNVPAKGKGSKATPSPLMGRLGIDHRPRKGGRGRQAAGLLPWAHTLFGNLKTWLQATFHGVSPKHLQRYLDEFVFRFDRRWQETELFIRVLNRATQAAPCSYRQLTAERIG